MEMALPALRQELRIEPGAPLVSGAPSWTLFDPLRHLFFQLGQIEHRILLHWANGTLGQAADDLVSQGLDPDESKAAISQVIEFSLTNNLTQTPLVETVATLNRQRESARRAWWKWLVDHYLFVRIPLVKPAAFLERTLPIVAPLWSRTSPTLFALLGITGLLLVSRQWDSFKASFLYFFSLEGLAAYAVALGLVKIIHELGHAYTATRFGCRVPTMGVSLLVMMPVLYTDTTAAWRLKSRRKRALIDVAGVTAELMVAVVATLIWVALPDGPIRSGCFVLATTSWVTSILINISPFMRYDGYYLLSDLLGVPNLQNRAFALARWCLREWLFGLGDAPPEDVPSRLRAGMITYAYVTWIYRLILFIGIALLVYHLFFKLLGIILFAVEMMVFVMRPILNETSVWWRNRQRIATSLRHRKWPWLAVSLAVAVILPLDRHVTAPAIMAPIGSAPIVAGSPATVERILVRNGQTVAAGMPLVILRAPELDRDAARHRVNIARIEGQLGRAMAEARDLSNRGVLNSELLAEREALATVEARQQRLVLRAPFAGQVTGIESDLHAGRWLGGDEIIAQVLTPGRYDVQAFVGESDIDRLGPEALARFVPNDAGEASYSARLVDKGTTALASLDQPLLASTHGGPIPVAEQSGKALKPRQTLYRLRLVTARDTLPRQDVIQLRPGVIEIEGASRSLAMSLLNQLAGLVRSEASMTR